MKAKFAILEETLQNWEGVLRNIVNHINTSNYKAIPDKLKFSEAQCMKKLILVEQLTTVSH